MKLERKQPEKELKIIYDLCESYYGVDMGRNTRKRPYVEKRAVYFLLCKELTPYSYAEIGATVGKDHATVVHSMKNVLPVLDDYHRKSINLLMLSCKKAVSRTVKPKKEDNQLLLQYMSVKNKYEELLDEATQMRQRLNNYPELVVKVSELMMQLDDREREAALERLETHVKVHRKFVESNLKKQPVHLDVIYSEV